MNEHDSHFLAKTPSPTPSKTPTHYEDIRLECVATLKKLEANLRVKGDFWRAEQVRDFTEAYFGEE